MQLFGSLLVYKSGIDALTSYDTAAASADIPHMQDPCAEYLAVVQRLLQISDSTVVYSPLFADLAVQGRALRQFLSQQTAGKTHPLDHDTKQRLLAVSGALTELAGKLLSARQQASDWAQFRYSDSLSEVLSVANLVYNTEVRHMGNSTAVSSLPGAQGSASWRILRSQTAAAQQEVCLMLQAARMQYGQHAAQQQIPHLFEFAVILQLFWLTVDSWRAAANDVALGQPAKAFALQEPVLMLAAELALSLTEDSNTLEFQVFAAVVKRASTLCMQMNQSGEGGKHNSIPTEPFFEQTGIHQALMYATLMMLLVQSYSVSQQQESSTGTGGPSAAAVGSSHANSSSSSSSSGATSSGDSSSPPEALRQLQQSFQQQCEKQAQHIPGITWQLWQQLGLSLDALPAFAAAVHPADLCLTSNICITHALTDSLQSILGPDVVSGQASTSLGHSGVQRSMFSQQPPQLQLLLARVLWQLPQLLLLLAAVAGTGVASSSSSIAVVSKLVGLAWFSLRAWRVPGVLAAAGSPAAAVLQQQCAAVQDAWLCVMQSLLLQPHHGLLQAAAAAQPIDMQRHISACLSTVRLYGRSCWDYLSGQWTCFEYDCCRMDTVGTLLSILQQLGQFQHPEPAFDATFSSSTGSSMHRSPSSRKQGSTNPELLLLLEALTRCVLPHHVRCSVCVPNRNSRIRTSSSSSGSDAAQHMRALFGVVVGLVGDKSEESSPVSTCISILCSGTSQLYLQHHQQQQQQQGRQYQGLLQLWSLTASLLKLPLRPVTGIPLLRACIHMPSVALNASQLILEHTESTTESSVSIAAQRIVFAPWLVLLGRSFVGLARALQAVQRQPPSVVAPYVSCMADLADALQRLPNVLDCWERSVSSSSGISNEQHTISSSSSSGGSDASVCKNLSRPGSNNSFTSCSSGSSSSSSSSSSSDDYFEVSSTYSCLHGLEQQLQENSSWAAALSSATVSVSADIAVTECGHTPSYRSLTVTDQHLPSVSSHIAVLLCLLTAAKTRLASVAAAGSTSNSSAALPAAGSSWRAGSRSTHAAAAAAGGRQVLVAGSAADEPASIIASINSSSTAAECWRCVTAYSQYQVACEDLQQLGLLLCNQLPMPWLCNNPHCSNLSGVSELQLVGGRGSVCGGCRVARYCSRNCQASHWASHKQVCLQLAAAAAAAAAAATA